MKKLLILSLFLMSFIGAADNQIINTVINEFFKSKSLPIPLPKEPQSPLKKKFYNYTKLIYNYIDQFDNGQMEELRRRYRKGFIQTKYHGPKGQNSYFSQYFAQRASKHQHNLGGKEFAIFDKKRTAEESKHLDRQIRRYSDSNKLYHGNQSKDSYFTYFKNKAFTHASLLRFDQLEAEALMLRLEHQKLEQQQLELKERKLRQIARQIMKSLK